MPKKRGSTVMIKSFVDPKTGKQIHLNAMDPDAKLIIVDRDGVKRRYKPTQMQLKAEYYRSQGMSKMGAMRKAGYSMKATATKMFSPQLAAYMNLAMKDSLIKRGITPDKIADKMVKWLEAEKVAAVTKEGEKIMTEDTAMQIKAYEKIDEVMHFSEPVRPLGATSGKKMTIESWTFGGEDETT